MLRGLPATQRKPTVGVRRSDDLAVAAALVSVTALLFAWLQLVGALPGEERLAHWARTTHLPGPVWDICSFFGAIGLPAVALATVGLMAFFAHRTFGPPAVRFLAVAFGGALVASVVKALLGATHPWHAIAPYAGANFPSGQVVYATCVFGAAALLV